MSASIEEWPVFVRRSDRFSKTDEVARPILQKSRRENSLQTRNSISFPSSKNPPWVDRNQGCGLVNCFVLTVQGRAKGQSPVSTIISPSDETAITECKVQSYDEIQRPACQDRQLRLTGLPNRLRTTEDDSVKMNGRSEWP
jgi:hypothetical protein